MLIARIALTLLLVCLSCLPLSAQDTTASSSTEEEVSEAPETEQSEGLPADGVVDVYVIPITEAIGKPNLFILRRGLKEAIANEVDMVLLEMDTPGGRVDVTIEMMEMLAKFEGITATYVSDEAISAGSFITASTQEIYFSPTGKIGASAVIMGAGQEVPETAKLKIESYLRANIRAITADYPYRSEVIRAMLDAEYELVIDEEVIKPAGELLTLTASEAMEEYGDPPQPLLGKGIYGSVGDLLDARFGPGNYEIKDFQITYSERIAKWMDTFAPALLGIGMLLLFLEFKTPGFGIFGIGGIVLIAIFFISQHIAGLAGNEAVLFFALGIILVLVELFFFPGTLVSALSGLALIVGSLLWAMVDIWPGEPIRFSPEFFAKPVVNLVFGMSIAVAGAIIFGRFFKGSWFERMLVLEDAAGGSSQTIRTERESSLPKPGSEGVAVSGLFPSGRVEVDGKRYEARSALGPIEHGRPIRVKAHNDFSVIVEEVES
jgi:membrane-bound serine protease (ClpP class)